VLVEVLDSKQYDKVLSWYNKCVEIVMEWAMLLETLVLLVEAKVSHISL
jgi:hypothetical protein